MADGDRERRRRRPRPALPLAPVPDRPGVDARAPRTCCATRSATRSWDIEVRDGAAAARVRAAGRARAGRRASRISDDTFRRLVSRELSPDRRDADAAHARSTARSTRSRCSAAGSTARRAATTPSSSARSASARCRRARAGSWGSSANGAVGLAGPGRPGARVRGQAPRGRRAADLRAALRAVGEAELEGARARLLGRQGAVARRRPAESQAHTAWSLGSFYIGEERVTADLAPFLLAAPSGEVEMFLATQLVDEARHTAFFDRFGGEVMALSADDLRGRMRELEQTMIPAWHDTFDGGLREVANRIKASARRPRPVRRGHLHLPPDHRGRARDDRPAADPPVHGGPRPLPGLPAGLLAGRARRAPPHRLRRALPPGRDGAGPRALRARSSSGACASSCRRRSACSCRRTPRARESFVSYGYDSTQIYGYAYRALKRRMAVIGLECPPPDELMPGPIAEGEAVQAVGAAA